MANLAWNIAEILRLNGSPPSQVTYAEVASELGNSLAMNAEGQRAIETGNTDRGRELLERASATAPPPEVPQFLPLRNGAC